MTKNDTNSKNSDDFMQGLGANESALLERIPMIPLRKLAAGMVRAKMRVQFTGWLQYLLPVIFILILALLAGVSRLFKINFLAQIFSVLGSLLFIAALFDLVTVKFNLRFSERLPKRNDALDLFDLMRARHSCRSFQTRKLTEADHAELMDSIQCHLAEPRIGEAPIRFEYIAAPLTVWPPVNATEFLVAIAPKEYDRLSVIDVGRSLQKVVLDVTRMGLGTCWIGPGADHASIMQNLGERFDSEKDHIVCVCAVGYKSNYIPLFIRIFNSRLSNSRLPQSELFFADADFIQPLDVDAPPSNHYGRNYEICQWAPSSYNGQTTRCAAVTDEKGAIKSFDFYAATASQYYAPVALGIWAANWEMGCDALGIQGHFAVRPTEKEATLPRYDLSWVAEEK
ncbi:MAG: nitroreductase family protein [Anaerolineales bacterium]|uniref:Nitroreductase family protein n=1 Tax=Candidatus Desulfolinea nitratireducens TaxID=2841698 RepID=A0A8J6NM10_9CHLR|nr:nitroreductase family protein [Candidatus Desulfolinea nitratireducens]MBL6960473.1 nitroreductase family protein [Anaerolineales bacterium]